MIQKIRKGFFGEYGGSFVPEALHVRLDELEEAYEEAKKDPSFSNEFITVLKEYVGRPSALTECKNISRHFGVGRLFL